MKMVSVIVPIYKVEKYLRECVDSILASTYRNLEIILVDDGSPDRCPEICDQYAEQDARIRVIHQKNQGLIAARNAGLKIATGDYIGFVDSDDAISPVMYELLADAIRDADMAACENCRTADKLVTTKTKTRPYVCMDSYDQQLAMLTNAPSVREITWTSGYVCDKLYRRELVTDLFRPECLMCEDRRFNWDYIRHSRKTAIVPMALYMYRQNPESVMSVYNWDKANPKVAQRGVADAKVWMLIAEHSPTQDKSLQDYLKAHAAYIAHGALWRAYSSKTEKEYAAFEKETRKLMKEAYQFIWNDRETYELHVRLVCGLCRYCFPVWKLVAGAYGMYARRKFAGQNR